MMKPLDALAPSTGRWPNTEQTLLLRAALLQGEAALEAWRAWRVNADLDKLPLGGFGLLPLLAYNLQRQGLADSLLDKCQGIRRRTWTQNQLQLRQLATLVQTLHDAGITPLLQDDVALTLLDYPEQGLRMIQRVQFLIPVAQAAAVPTRLAQAGWRSQPTKKAWLRALVIGGSQPQRCQQPGNDLVLDWQQASPGAYPPLADDLWQRARPLTISGVETQCVSATDLFYALCVQGIAAFWRFGAIQWLADASMLLHTAAPALDWSRLVAQSSQQAFTVRMRAAWQGLQAWVDAPIPPAPLAALATLSSRPFERWEAQDADWQSSSVGKVGALWVEAQRRRWWQGQVARKP